jgi:hypothetical protein
MGLMTYLQPYISYMICAIILCVMYIGLEQSHGPIGNTAKSVICSWCIISTVVIIALYGIQTQLENFRPVSPHVIIGTGVASIVTLSISSCCVNSAT